MKKIYKWLYNEMYWLYHEIVYIRKSYHMNHIKSIEINKESKFW